MPFLDLNTAQSAELQQQLNKHTTVVACLCAAWCDVCSSYRGQFETLAQHHPDFLFLWVDIEDQAELVGDFDVENFPTLLIQQQIQQHQFVTFYGTMQPDTKQLNRLLKSQVNLSFEQLQQQSTASEQQRSWQSSANLVRRLL